MALMNNTLSIHEIMKQPYRQIYGKVHVTYTDPLLNDTIYDVNTSNTAYNSEPMQVVDSVLTTSMLFATLYDNDLTGGYSVSSADSQVGWTSAVLSDSTGVFADTPYILIEFEARPISNFSVYFDDTHLNTAKDFTVEFIKSDGAVVTKTISGNEKYTVQVLSGEAVSEVVGIRLTVMSCTTPYYPITIIDMAVSSEFVYTGYRDASNIISISLLEELTYNDDIEALGGMSANEVTVSFDNSDRLFNLTNEASPISRQLRRNRKIRPFLGIERSPGNIEWYSLGTFWSYKWDVPVDDLIAKVIGFDTLGLLDITTYTDHQVLVAKSLGALIDIVLTDAKKLFSFLEWEVDNSLYSVVIPYTWFAAGSHAAALRRICEAYPMHIYCNREGRIVAAPQKLHIDDYVDVWSGDTNVVDKTYNSLYTVLPNVINVTVRSPILKENDELTTDELQFDIADIPKRTLNFNSPYVSGLSVDIERDGTVSYTYTAYSWGIEISFTGYGNVYSIKCTGTSLDTTHTSVITYRDEQSIRSNGIVTREVSADFIQTVALANYIISRLAELAELDKYDVEVTYRGDIALTVNDTILLLDGIAPSNNYNIKRHQLLWDGSLTGTANLNT